MMFWDLNCILFRTFISSWDVSIYITKGISGEVRNTGQCCCVWEEFSLSTAKNRIMIKVRGTI